MKRASLFTIRAILRSVDRGSGPSQRARFSELAMCTPGLRNRKSMIQYLKLLAELGWLEKKEKTLETLYNPLKNRARYRRWTVYVYRLTELGKAFLELFPPDLVIPAPQAQEDDGLPTPEEQAHNWEAFRRGEWNLGTPGADF